jgi:glycosyltransferase involved in cell wall biosynthesis
MPSSSSAADRPQPRTADAAGLPFVSVVIPHYNDLENLAQCLTRLERQTWPRDRFEIVVADNNSRGGIAALRALSPRIHAIPAPEQGAGPARNAGVAAATGEVLAFIDSDCSAEPQWLEEGLAGLKLFDYVGGQVRTTIPPGGNLTPAEAFEAVFAFNIKSYIEKQRFTVTANLFVPRTVFDKVGGFHNGVSEDNDWCHRANALGYRLGYIEEAVVSHPARREWRDLTRKWDRINAEHLAIARRRKGWQVRWSVLAIATLASPIPHSLRVLASPRLKGFRAKFAGLVGLFGIRFYRAIHMIRIMMGTPPSISGART